MKLESRSTLLARYARSGLTPEVLDFGLSRGLFSRMPTTLPLTDDTPLWDEDKVIANFTKVVEYFTANQQRDTFVVKLSDWLREAFDDPTDAYRGDINPFNILCNTHAVASTRVPGAEKDSWRLASPFLHDCYFKSSVTIPILKTHIARIWPAVRRDFLASGAAADPATGESVIGSQYRLLNFCKRSPHFGKAAYRDGDLVGFNIYPGVVDSNRYFTETNIDWTYLEPSLEGATRGRGRPAGSKLSDVKRKEFTYNLKKTREAKLKAVVDEIMQNPKQVTPELLNTLPPKVRKAIYDAALRNAQEEAA